jgi:hypothetical protein
MLRRFQIPHCAVGIAQFERLLILQSQLEGARRLAAPLPRSLHELEYSVFSQFGDDGIIQFLAGLIPPEFHSFIEFGVQDYQESNTRLLLQRDNWRGLVIDASTENLQKIKNSYYFWRHDLTAISEFVTKDNINSIISDAGFHGKVGLLHIDIDGMDYWVWEAIEIVRPLIFIAEYNSVFGWKSSVTVPYQERFNRHDAHPSNLYFGASLSAFVDLGVRRGYRFLGCNQAGNNAFFLDCEIESCLPVKTSESGYVRSKFREGRGGHGTLLHKTAHELVSAIGHLPVVDLRTETQHSVDDLDI